MSRGAAPTAVVVRRCGIALVLVSCAVATAVNHGELLRVMVDWLAFALYVFCCAEPLRRVRRGARTSRTLLATYVVVTLACVGYVFLAPVTYYDGARIVQVSVAARLARVDSLSDAAAQRSSDLGWLAFAVVALGTLTLWSEVLRLARRSEWHAIDPDAERRIHR